MVGPLLTSPPPPGRLRAELERFSQQSWQHPSRRGAGRFAASTIARGRQWRRLSPAFDPTPSPVTAQERRDLAMACVRFGLYANRPNLLSSRGRFPLEQAKAEAVFDRIAGIVRKRCHAEIRRAGASKRDCEAIGPTSLYGGLYYENLGEARLGCDASRARLFRTSFVGITSRQRGAATLEAERDCQLPGS